MDREESQVKILKVSLLVTALMLCFAVIPGLPSAYFVVLRGVVFGTAAYAAFRLKDHDVLSLHFLPLVLLAILFNPLIPFSLTPLLWLIISLAGAVYCLNLSKKI